MKRDYLRRLFRVIFGNTLMGLGIALEIAAQLGGDPWTALSLGTSNTFGITPGQASQAQAVVLMAGAFLLFHRRLGLGTIFNIILVGYFIDVFQTYMFTPATISGRFLMLVIAIIILGFGVAIYVSAELGEGPIEQLMIGFTENSHWPVGKIRIIMDSLAAIVGFLLGGSIGFGTLVSAFSIGPVVQKSLSILPGFTLEKECE